MHRPDFNMPTGLLRSSGPLGWAGAHVERRRNPAGEWHTPALASHLVSLKLGPPMRLRQARDDRFVEGETATGTSQLVAAGTPSTWIHDATADIAAIHIAPQALRRCYEESTGRDGARIALRNAFSVQDPQITWLGRELHREMLARGENGPLYADALAAAFTALLVQRYCDHVAALPRPPSPRALTPHKLARLLEFIHAHLSQPLRLAEMAAQCDCSVTSLVAGFKAAKGMPPHEYMLRQRVQLARALMQRGVAPAHAAAQAGFCDQSHLRRHLRRLQGVC